MSSRSWSIYLCSNCGSEYDTWLGKCPSCGAWNTLEVQRTRGRSADQQRKNSTISTTERPPEIVRIDELANEQVVTSSSGIEELDRILGGGIVPGMTVLVGGEPGIGKSTLMMQLLSQQNAEALYISTEESANHLQLRASRLALAQSQFHILCSSNVEEILRELRRFQPKQLIIDSVQMLYSDEIESARGSVAQVRHGSQACIDWAQQHGCALFLVAHVTKEGTIAGPKLIEHVVDTVLYFEDSAEHIRYLRAVKNRFGTVDEVGLFQMEKEGLRAIEHPEQLFRDTQRQSLPPGVAVAPIFEGSRILMIEIQALTVHSGGSLTRVYSDRIDARRISRLAAVLERHLKVPLGNKDIFINVAGGIQIREVGVELAIAHALYSAHYNLPLAIDACLMGEVSLAGEIRPLSQLARRLRVAREMGYKTCVGPPLSKAEKVKGLTWIQCSTLQESIKKLFGPHVAPS